MASMAALTPPTAVNAPLTPFTITSKFSRSATSRVPFPSRSNACRQNRKRHTVAAITCKRKERDSDVLLSALHYTCVRVFACAVTAQSIFFTISPRYRLVLSALLRNDTTLPFRLCASTANITPGRSLRLISLPIDPLRQLHIEALRLIKAGHMFQVMGKSIVLTTTHRIHMLFTRST